ncbi:uncharacterized protein LOC122230693 [Panthera tigris]|uniref:uncharacterized protein LOC122230693 n=1 Tax=Panthera tigris TaxID=9694 RepID=UPI001C6F9ED8|nr:uncharacterized protein LOC122230693 [Panthera tigris]
MFPCSRPHRRQGPTEVYAYGYLAWMVPHLLHMLLPYASPYSHSCKDSRSPQLVTHAPPHEGDCFFSHGENRSNQKRPSSGSPAVLHLACILSLVSGLLPQASPSARALQLVASHSFWNIALTVPSPSNLSLDPAFSSTHHSLPFSCSTAPQTRELCRLTPASLFSFSLHHRPSRSVATSGLQLSVLVSSDLSAACATGLLYSFCLEALLSLASLCTICFLCF